MPSKTSTAATKAHRGGHPGPSHLAERTRTARFNKWLQNNPGVSLEMAASHLGRSVKTAYMWRIGRPSEIPDWALRLLEETPPPEPRP